MASMVPSHARATTLLLLAVSVACGPRRGGATTTPSDADDRGGGATVDATDAPRDLAGALREAEDALQQERAAEAVALFGRVVGEAAATQEQRRRALLGLAQAHEDLRDCAAAVRTWDAYLDRHGRAEDAAIAYARRGACEAELGRWEASARSFEAVAVAPGQLPSTRIEALARQGYALFNLDRFDDADRVLTHADEVFVQAERDASERFSTYYFVGMARFYRAAILHRRFREVTIELPEKVMAARFKQKLELLVAAQDAYNATIKAKHMFWVSAAGFQLGTLFSEFYDALMYAPVPAWLDARHKQIYYDELKKQIRPIVDKAIWVFEKNLETARRLGYESEFTAQTEAKLSHLQAALHGDDADLGKPLARLAGEPATAGPERPTGTSAPPGEDGPAPRAADRKLFVPPMTPLSP